MKYFRRKEIHYNIRKRLILLKEYFWRADVFLMEEIILRRITETSLCRKMNLNFCGKISCKMHSPLESYYIWAKIRDKGSTFVAQNEIWRWATKVDHLSSQNNYIWGAWGGPPNLIFIGILLFLLLRNPCKNLKSYDNPFFVWIGGDEHFRKTYGLNPYSFIHIDVL